MNNLSEKSKIEDIDNIQSRLAKLNLVIQEFIKFYKTETDFSILVNTSWSAKDILGHVTFWHQSFARNISSLGKQEKPNVLKGKLSEVNDLSVQSTEKLDITQLICNLRNSQKEIEKHIFNEDIKLIPYKKGSRDYSRAEHLEIVYNHIKKHLKEVRKASNATSKKQKRIT